MAELITEYKKSRMFHFRLSLSKAIHEAKNKGCTNEEIQNALRGCLTVMQLENMVKKND